MRVFITGSSGLVGVAVGEALRSAGHSVTRLVRSHPAPGDVEWNPQQIAGDSLEGFDAGIHLAGEPILGLWTASKMAAIRDSRVEGTRRLCEALATLKNPPKVLVCASGAGYYGDRQSALLTEEDGPGQGFLADVCVGWESATGPANDCGIRVVNTRLGLVLAKQGGPLKQLLIPFRLGLGGPLGNGRQYMPWIAIEDVVGVILFAIKSESLRGPVNTVAPEDVTNLQFTRTLGKVLHRPTLFAVPAAALRLAMGGFAENALLPSQRLRPARLLEAGYSFTYPTLEPCLRACTASIA